jgi:hypothetical protein
MAMAIAMENTIAKVFEPQYLVAIGSRLTVMVSDKYIFARLSTESNYVKIWGVVTRGLITGPSL